MKITKTLSQVNNNAYNESVANIGCENCPECGTKFTGILLEKTYAGGLFATKSYRIDCYHCRNCGCEWESEPYQY